MTLIWTGNMVLKKRKVGKFNAWYRKMSYCKSAASANTCINIFYKMLVYKGLSYQIFGKGTRKYRQYVASICI